MVTWIRIVTQLGDAILELLKLPSANGQLVRPLIKVKILQFRYIKIHTWLWGLGE